MWLLYCLPLLENLTFVLKCVGDRAGSGNMALFSQTYWHAVEALSACQINKLLKKISLLFCCFSSLKDVHRSPCYNSSMIHSDVRFSLFLQRKLMVGLTLRGSVAGLQAVVLSCCFVNLALLWPYSDSRAAPCVSCARRRTAQVLVNHSPGSGD